MREALGKVKQRLAPRPKNDCYSFIFFVSYEVFLSLVKHLLVSGIFFACGAPKTGLRTGLFRSQEQNYPMGFFILLNKVLLHISRECACASRHSS